MLFNLIHIAEIESSNAPNPILVHVVVSAVLFLLIWQILSRIFFKPVFKVLPGWKCDIRGIKNYEDLPEACRNYVETIEKEIEAPITMVSNGPGRHEIIHRVSSYGK